MAPLASATQAMRSCKSPVAMNVHKQYATPIDNPPATDAANPMPDTPPLVPAGTWRPLVTKRGCDLLRTPNYMAKQESALRVRDQARDGDGCDTNLGRPRITIATCKVCNDGAKPKRSPIVLMEGNHNAIHVPGRSIQQAIGTSRSIQPNACDAAHCAIRKDLHPITLSTCQYNKVQSVSRSTNQTHSLSHTLTQ
jgi:hypothetical protein